MDLSKTAKILITIATLLVVVGMLWLYHESILAGIYPDYAVDPFETHNVCQPNSPQPYIWPETMGQ